MLFQCLQDFMQLVKNHFLQQVQIHSLSSIENNHLQLYFHLPRKVIGIDYRNHFILLVRVVLLQVPKVELLLQ
jgi:hypothetical protein